MIKFVIQLFILNFLCVQYSYSETITVVTEYLEPYQIKKEDGSLDGFMTDVVRSLFKITGDVPKIKVMPWARAYKTAQEENVLIYSIVYTKERSNKFIWVGNVEAGGSFFWQKKGKHTQKFNSIEEFKKYRIAVLRSSNIANYLKSLSFENLYEISFEEQSLDMLTRDRVDFVVGAEISILSRLDKLGLSYSSVEKAFEMMNLNNDLGIAFNINTKPELVERFEKAFIELKASGELDKIKKKWSMN